MENFFFHSQPYYDSAVDVWRESPSKTGILVYSILTPGICLCGIAGNFICLLVLNTSELHCSFYVYLSAIAVVDLFSCAAIFLSGLARGVFWGSDGWVAYDALIGVPLTGFLSYVSTIATVFVTIDRLIYLKKPARRLKPKFCKRKTAWLIIIIGVLISAVFTVPYCFIYELTDDGYLQTTDFYQTTFYAVYNWFDVVVFAILPLIFLSIGNTMLVWSIKHAWRMLNECKILTGKTRRMKDQTKVTATLIAMVLLYLIGEVPTHFTNRKTAANILFGGDDEKANESLILEILRQVTTVLNAFHLAIKFVLYSLFCPPFYRALKNTILPKACRKKRIEARNASIKVFFVDDGSIRSNDSRRYRFDLNQLGFMNIFINVKAANEMPRLF